jgi:hypothetical protein
MSHLEFVNETLREPAACDYGALGEACCKLLPVRELWKRERWAND